MHHNKELILKILVLIVLLLLIVITGFRSGEKFYILQNTNLGPGKNKIDVRC